MILKTFINPKAKFAFFLVISCFLSACETIVDIELEEEEPILVVDGLLTNKAEPHLVKLSTSQNFFLTNDSPKIDDAIVVITDITDALVDTLKNLGNGNYETRTLIGIPGHEYELTVDFDGTKYVAIDQMPLTNAILDTLFVVRQSDESFRAFFSGIEPIFDVNFYRFQTFTNGVLRDNGINLTISDDVALEEVILEVDIGFDFFSGETLVFELHSISEQSFEYYSQLLQVYLNDGGLFSGVPVNPISNISNGGLGIFRTTLVERRTVEIP